VVLEDEITSPKLLATVAGGAAKVNFSFFFSFPHFFFPFYSKFHKYFRLKKLLRDYYIFIYLMEN